MALSATALMKLGGISFCPLPEEYRIYTHGHDRAHCSQHAPGVSPVSSNAGVMLPVCHLQLLLLLVVLEPGHARRSVGVVSDKSVGGWLLLPRTAAHLAWLRHSRPGQFWAVMSLDTATERPGSPTHYVTTGLSGLHKSWFSKYSKDHSLPPFNSVNNGHQGTPIYYGDLSHTSPLPVAPTVGLLTTARPSYYNTVRVKTNPPSLLQLLFKIIPSKLYFWFKNYIKTLIYYLVFLHCTGCCQG